MITARCDLHRILKDHVITNSWQCGLDYFPGCSYTFRFGYMWGKLVVINYGMVKEYVWRFSKKLHAHCQTIN